MRTCVFLTAFAIATMMATVSFAKDQRNVDFEYYKVEQVPGTGSSNPTWTSTHTGYSTDDNNQSSFTVVLDWDFPRTDIDAFRVKIQSDYDPFYDHDHDNWLWRDTVEETWKQGCDYEGYLNGSYYYRAQEHNDIGNDDYDWDDYTVRARWGWTSPGTQYNFYVKYASGPPPP